jgi:hypothetical protein
MTIYGGMKRLSVIVRWIVIVGASLPPQVFGHRLWFPFVVISTIPMETIRWSGAARKHSDR